MCFEGVTISHRHHDKLYQKITSWPPLLSGIRITWKQVSGTQRTLPQWHCLSGVVHKAQEAILKEKLISPWWLFLCKRTHIPLPLAPTLGSNGTYLHLLLLPAFRLLFLSLVFCHIPIETALKHPTHCHVHEACHLASVLQLHSSSHHCFIIHQTYVEYLWKFSSWAVMRSVAVRFWGEYMVSVLRLHCKGEIRYSE